MTRTALKGCPLVRINSALQRFLAAQRTGHRGDSQVRVVAALTIAGLLAFLVPRSASGGLTLGPGSFGTAYAIAYGFSGAISDTNSGLSGSVAVTGDIGSSASATWSLSAQGMLIRLHSTYGGGAQVVLNADVASDNSIAMYIREQRSGFNGTVGPIDRALVFPNDYGVQATLPFGFGSPPRSDEYVAVFSETLIFPGEQPDNPREYDGGVDYEPESDDEPSVHPRHRTFPGGVRGLWGGLPVGGSYGVTSPVYFGDATPAIADSPAAGPNGASGYLFAMRSGVQFTSFTTPNGIPGDTSGAYISDGATSVPYMPGTTYTFPSPVPAFAILGLDPSVMPLDGPALFVHGLTFDQDGPAIFMHVPLLPVPEPTSLVLGSLGFSTLLVGACRRRRRSSHSSPQTAAKLST